MRPHICRACTRHPGTFKIQTPEVSSGVACLGFEDFERNPLILTTDHRRTFTLGASTVISPCGCLRDNTGSTSAALRIKI